MRIKVLTVSKKSVATDLEIKSHLYFTELISLVLCDSRCKHMSQVGKIPGFPKKKGGGNDKNNSAGVSYDQTASENQRVSSD